MNEEKLTGRLLVALGDQLERDLRRVAKKADVSAAELLRRAARALVACDTEFGSIPLDMQLIQARHPTGGAQSQRDFPETRSHGNRAKAS